MTLKQQVNGTVTDWVVRVLIGLALGWFFREGAYLRDRVAVMEQTQLEIRGTRFTAAQGAILREQIYQLERILQTKADADQIRREILEWQEKVDVRIRELEVSVR